MTGMLQARLNEAWQIAKELPWETYRRHLDLKMQGPTLGTRGATSSILMWHRARVEGEVPALWMTKTLLAASVKLRDCPHLWKFVNGPASAVVGSMMRFGWQVSVGHRIWNAKGCLELRIGGSPRFARRAASRLRQVELGTRGDQTPGTGTGGWSASLCTSKAHYAAPSYVTWRGAPCSL